MELHSSFNSCHRNRGLRTTIAWAALALLLGACSDSPGGTGGADAGIPCQGEADCPAGYTCGSNNICVPAGDDAGVDAQTQPGEINMFPDPVQFGFAPLHVDTEQTVTVVNVGQGPLAVTEIQVVENDLLAEYSANPSGPQTVVLQPNEELQISVLLHPEDTELDFGSLEVHSDDPNLPIASVQLESEYKGVQILELCVLDESASPPTPFVDCEVDTVNGDPLMDYGVVPFGTPVAKTAAIRNAADGNAPLEISDVVVQTVDATMDNEFTLRLYRLDTDGVTEIDVTLPVLLSAGDPAQALEPEVIYAEVTFGANLDGVISGSLVVTSNDPNASAVPISALVSGCPPGFHDINGDPSDGCEYPCNYAGPEVCGSGIDENCDAQQDTEDAIGCTVYYRDVDGDDYGITADFKCLCAPDAIYRATLPGECNDSNNQINPLALEVCDNLDNNCVGGIDENLIQGCAVTNVNGTCTGTETCSAGSWVGCTAATPAPETCNNADDNCNGSTDENLIQGCSVTNGWGTCTGTETCSAGSWVGCTAATPADETCNNVDDDCDGSTDENLTQSCSVTNGWGTCTGTESCSAGSWVSCTAATPQQEICDQQDNDCDGSIDEGLPLDGYENNNTCAGQYYLGDLTEGGTTNFVASIYPSGDQDYYRQRTTEQSGFCIPGTNEGPYYYDVTLVPPAGEDYGFRLCYKDRGSTSCGSYSGCWTQDNFGNGGTESISINWTGTCGSEDGYEFFIWVFPNNSSQDWSCSNYTLTISFDQ